MSKVKCNQCGETIKIKTIFLESAGCENCGNRINFSTMDALTGVRAGLLFATAAILGVACFIVMVMADVKFAQLPQVFLSMSIEAFGLLLLFLMVVVLVVGTLERIIGCRVYEQWRKREEELKAIEMERQKEREENNQ